MTSQHLLDELARLQDWETMTARLHAAADHDGLGLSGYKRKRIEEALTILGDALHHHIIRVSDHIATSSADPRHEKGYDDDQD